MSAKVVIRDAVAVAMRIVKIWYPWKCDFDLFVEVTNERCLGMFEARELRYAT